MAGSGPIIAVVVAARLPMSSPPDPPSPAELNDLLLPLASQLIWWQPADVSLRNPDRVIAQVLDLGTFEAGLWRHRHRLALRPSGVGGF